MVVPLAENSQSAPALVAPILTVTVVPSASVICEASMRCQMSL